MAERTDTGPDDWKKKIALFQYLTPEDLAALGSFAQIRRFDREERIFEQGEPSDHLHFVIAGRVKVVKSRADGQEVIFEIIGDGDPVGCVAALEGSPYPASAVVHEPCRILTLPRKRFLDFLGSHPGVARGLLAGFCRRNLQLVRRIADFPGSVAARLVRLFLTLADRFGVKQGAGVHIPLSLSRQEIADLVGTTLETAIRILSRWGKEGLVLTQADGFTIPDLEALGREIGG